MNPFIRKLNPPFFFTCTIFMSLMILPCLLSCPCAHRSLCSERWLELALLFEAEPRQVIEGKPRSGLPCPVLGGWTPRESGDGHLVRGFRPSKEFFLNYICVISSKSGGENTYELCLIPFEVSQPYTACLHKAIKDYFSKAPSSSNVLSSVVREQLSIHSVMVEN